MKAQRKICFVTLLAFVGSIAGCQTANEHRNRNGLAMRLTNPTPTVQQMIELARLHHLFEIAPSGGTPDGERPPATRHLT